MGNETPAQKQAREKKEAEDKAKKDAEAKAKTEAEAKAKAAAAAAAEGEGDPPEVTEAPSKAKKDKWKEDLSPKLLKALAEDGYKAEAVLAVRSYKESKLWRVTMSDGQRHEIGFDGKWVSQTKAQKAVAKKEREKAGLEQLRPGQESSHA